MRTIVFSLLFFLSSSAFAIVGTTLDHPQTDLKRFFPNYTRYRVRDLIPVRHGEGKIVENIEKELEEKLDAEYERADAPHTFYVVYRQGKYLGVVYGVTARGESGPMQIFIGYDASGRIKDVYVQKIGSSEISAFRSKFYRDQYRKFTTAHLPETSDIKPPTRVPSAEVIKDHHQFIRAVRVNLLFIKHLYNKFKE